MLLPDNNIECLAVYLEMVKTNFEDNVGLSGNSLATHTATLSAPIASGTSSLLPETGGDTEVERRP